MNIAIVTTEFVSENRFDGGLANYTYKLAKWLIEKGHTATVFLIGDNETTFEYDGIPVKKIQLTDHVWRINYRAKRFGLSFFVPQRKLFFYQLKKQSLELSKKIIAHYSAKPVDIIHYPHLGGFAFCKPASIPNIIRLSSSTALCQQMGGYDEDAIKMEEQIKVEALAMKNADTVFGPSKMVASVIEKEIHRKIEIIETPFSDIKINTDAGLYEQQLKDKKYILFFGSIGLIKGVGTIAEMIFDLLEKQPDLYVVFVGKKLNNTINNIPLWDYLLRKAGKHHSRIMHFESLKHDRLFPVIKNAQCVLLPSRVDNFPNTCIEAMANSKIVIGTYGNGFDQLIENGENGFLINVDDHAALLKQTLHVLSLAPAEKKDIENKARLRIDNLHPDIVLEELITLYKTTIAKFKN